MAIGGAAPIIAAAVQYGLPAAIELVKLGTKWVEYWSSDAAKQLTQDEFNAKWAEMQSEYKAATDAHEALRQQGR